MLAHLEDTENATKQQAIVVGILATIGVILLMAFLIFTIGDRWNKIAAPFALTYDQVEQKIAETGLNLEVGPQIEGAVIPNENGDLIALNENGHILAIVEEGDGAEYLTSTPYAPYAEFNIEADDVLARTTLAGLMREDDPIYPVYTGCVLIATEAGEEPYAKVWKVVTTNIYGWQTSNNQYAEIHVPQSEIDRVSSDMGDALPEGAGTVLPLN